MSTKEKLMELLSTYQDVVKPLLADIKVRSKDNKIPINCLNEIRAINDHIARCYRNNMEESSMILEIGKAEGHLKRLIFDCFKQLNIFLFDKIESKEKKFYSTLWLYWDNGSYWKDYKNARMTARYASIEAKKQETVNQELAMAKYEEAYCNYCKIESLLNNKGKMLWWSFIYKWITLAFSGIRWLFTTLILSLIAAIIANYI